MIVLQNIRDEILKQSQKAEDLKKADSFILVCLSHGNQGNIFGSDGEPVNIDKDIVEPFDGKHCPHLIGKPKLFFIQACQGGKCLNLHVYIKFGRYLDSRHHQQE